MAAAVMSPVLRPFASAMVLAAAGMIALAFAAGISTAAFAAPNSISGQKKGDTFQTAAPNAILIDAESNSVLFEKSADELVFPASLAKLMTAEVVFNAVKRGDLKLDDMFTISENAWRHGGAPSHTSSMFAPIHSRVRVDDLLHGVIIQSGNDASMALAEGISGNEAAFAEKMTKRARELGLTKSTFGNSTGLPDPNTEVTVRELAKLARHIIRTYPDFYRLYGEHEFTWNKIRQYNRNPLLGMGIGADGLKTGYIRASGYNVATSAVRNGRRIIAVVMGGRSAYARDAQMMALLDQGFVLAATQPKTQVASATLPQPPTLASVQTSKAAGKTVGAPAILMPPTKPAVLSASGAAPEAVTVRVADVVQDAAPAADAAQEPDAAQIASIEPTAAPATTKSKSSAARGRWGIQVGAFNAYELALNAAKRASKRVATLVKNAEVVVDETAKGNATLYRARLVGLSKQNAHSACRQLKAKSIDCLVFQADVALAMNSEQ